jgi:hypothetical protein
MIWRSVNMNHHMAVAYTSYAAPLEIPAGRQHPAQEQPLLPMINLRLQAAATV